MTLANGHLYLMILAGLPAIILSDETSRFTSDPILTRTCGESLRTARLRRKPPCASNTDEVLLVEAYCLRMVEVYETEAGFSVFVTSGTDFMMVFPYQLSSGLGHI